MTLFEDSVDESDADVSDTVDISLVKKLTSKLPKIGARLVFTDPIVIGNVL